MSATLWYRFTPASDGLISADTFGSSYDTILAVYEGGERLGLRELGCSDGYFLSYGEHVMFEALAGRTYMIQAGGFGGAVGHLRFHLSRTHRGALQGGRKYVEMADGVEVAAYVTFPPGWDGSPLPALFEYDGYDGGARPGPMPGLLDPEGSFAWVHGGARGTGCSGGALEIYGEQTARDGAALVEWIARQPWSDGNVGMVGHDFSASLGASVAAQRPPHLRALTISGLVGDLYRDFVYPGGVFNSSLPALFVAAIRPADDLRRSVAPAGGPHSRGYPADLLDPRCAQNIATRPPSSQDTLIRGVSETEDSRWWHGISLLSVAHRIRVPTQIFGTYQDEQTLGRAPAVIWERLRVRNKQLILTNGSHNAWTGLGGRADPLVIGRRIDWLRRWVAGEANGIERQSRVQMLLESHFEGSAIAHSGVVASDSFPLRSTRWAHWYVAPGRVLTPTVPGASGSHAFIGGTGRHLSAPDPSIDSSGGYGAAQEVFWSDGPDSVSLRTGPFTAARVVAGPMVATLHVRVQGPDASVFVQVLDEDASGNRSLLQRGMLKASHRRLDAARSWFDGKVMYRPWHPHTEPSSLTPGEVTEMAVEIWPVGFVLRKGHRLVVTITSPPAAETFHAWQPRTPPVPVEILYGPDHPSLILVPFVPAPRRLGPALPCGAQIAVRCAKPLNAN